MAQFLLTSSSEDRDKVKWLGDYSIKEFTGIVYDVNLMRISFNLVLTEEAKIQEYFYKRGAYSGKGACHQPYYNSEICFKL